MSLEDKYGGLEVCYLADARKRITSPSFNVYIPRLMSRVNNEGTANNDESIDSSVVDQEGAAEAFGGSVQTQSYITATAATPYRYSQDGRIPEYKIESMVFDEIAAEATDGQDENGDKIKKPLKLFNVSAKTMVVTNSTEVNYMDTNKIYISKGHKMYGHFVAGTANAFVVTAIDMSMEYFEE